MGTENVENGLPKRCSVLSEMDELVATSETNRLRTASQVFDGILQALLPLPLLGVEVGCRMRSRGVSLRRGRLFHCPSTLVRYQGLQHEHDTGNSDTQQLQDLSGTGQLGDLRDDVKTTQLQRLENRQQDDQKDGND